MEPVNSQERSSAILKFALLLFFTILIVVVAVYWDYAVPVKHISVLKEEKAQMEAMLGSEQNILIRLDSINDRFVRYDADVTPITENSIASELALLAPMADTTVKGKVLKDVIYAYQALLQSKKALKSSANAAAHIADLEKQLAEGKDAFKELETAKKECERDLRSYTGR